MSTPRDLSIVRAVALMQSGTLKSQDLVASCLERIHLREEAIRAWVELYEEEALEEARVCDNAIREGTWRGPLHGIPVGIKDIIDVQGMWTRAGCSLYPARVAESDAWAVRRIRKAGAIIVGKTETTAFANNDPADTRNPWNQSHTPGGSSSGSGAAVADRMCMAALGSQTAGSVLRPAAYNGIVGFKPTYASIGTEGVIPVSWTLDHVGPLTRNVEDARLLYNVLRDDCPRAFASRPMRADKIDHPQNGHIWRLGYVREFVTREAADETVSHLESIREIFESRGTDFVDLDLSDSMQEALRTHRVIMDAELASYHRTLFASQGEYYPPNIRARIEKGLKTESYLYIDAMHRRIAFQTELSAALADVDAVLLPVAPSTAPQGLSSTGSPVFCAPWTFAGFPSIAIPSGMDDRGLPCAIQIGGKPTEEERLFDIASWCEDVLGLTLSPAP